MKEKISTKIDAEMRKNESMKANLSLAKRERGGGLGVIFGIFPVLKKNF